jgi:trk system potassium uptake protein TrkH
MTKEGVATLNYPVRGPVILKYLGQLGLMLALLTLMPFAVSLLFDDHTIGGRYLVMILALLILGVPLSRLSVPPFLQTNEALTITAMAFLLSPLVMTYPLMGAGLSFEDALFEAISGVTTTGLSVLPSVEDRAPSLVFARAWMQWYGGLGIAILSVTLLMGEGIASNILIYGLCVLA